jgi:hypothetical protein
VSDEPLGARLKAAAATARGEWLMFLRPGVVPGPNWGDEAFAFVQQITDPPHAAVFAAEISGFAAWLRHALSALPQPEQGLILRKSFYEQLGGHHLGAADAEADLLRRIGRRRVATLGTAITKPNI